MYQEDQTLPLLEIRISTTSLPEEELVAFSVSGTDRVDGRVVGEGVLIVTAVRREDGLREILAVEVADTESEATYQELFRSLKARGLSGVELVTSDDHPGLEAAMGRHFQGAGWQRCQVYYARNLPRLVSFSKREELAAGLRGIFAAPDMETALRLADQLADRWRKSHPKEVADHLKEHVGERREVPSDHSAADRSSTTPEPTRPMKAVASRDPARTYAGWSTTNAWAALCAWRGTDLRAFASRAGAKRRVCGYDQESLRLQ